MRFYSLLCLFVFASLSLAYPLFIRGEAEGEGEGLVARQFGKPKKPAAAPAAAVKPTAPAVKTAVTNFAKDANTVSASLNQMGTETDPATIKSLASTAFDAESDEDAQRSVLASAAGTAGSTANTKIVMNTPTVLDGLMAIMQNPSQASTSKNVDTIEAARNPQILPSITQLSNSALQAMNLPATAQTFPATGQNN